MQTVSAKHLIKVFRVAICRRQHFELSTKMQIIACVTTQQRSEL